MAMHQFKAESKKLLDLMINSIYTNREIFLRELISNASDAVDKLNFKSLTDDSMKVDQDDLSIRVSFDRDARTITVSDNGIGMTADELEKNLGTIAHSGSQEFKTENAESQGDAVDIIGQFGVGFYSAFMVAKRVQVVSRAYGEDAANVWESDGLEGYTIEPGERAGHGTAHAGIDLIEDEGIHTVGLPQNDFAGKHDARELAARGDAPKRSRRQAGTAAVQKLARRRSSLVPTLTRQRPRLPNELSVSHLQTRHLFASLAAKARRCLITALGKHLGRFGERRLCNIDRLLRALDPRLTIAYDGKQLARILAAGKDVFHARAELSEQSLKR